MIPVTCSMLLCAIRAPSFSGAGLPTGLKTVWPGANGVPESAHTPGAVALVRSHCCLL